MNKIYEVVSVFDIEPFSAGEGDAFRFRLEVFRDLNEGRFGCKVYRLETYRLQPTFPQSECEVPDWRNDTLIYVMDDVLNAESLIGNSVQEVVEKFQKKLIYIFGER